MKPCPNCDAQNGSRASACVKCGEPFASSGRKQQEEQPARSISVSFSGDGSMTCIWHGRHEYLCFTAAETEIIAHALRARK